MNEQCFKAGSLDHIINSLKCGNPSQVKVAAEAAGNILSRPLDIQQALDKGILDALVQALTDADDVCKASVSWAISNLCEYGSPSQLRVLAEGAALEPYCRLLAHMITCYCVMSGLSNLLQRVEQITKRALLLKLRDIGVPQLLRGVRQDLTIHDSDRRIANALLQAFFSDGE